MTTKKQQCRFPLLFEKALTTFISQKRELEAIDLVNSFGELQITYNPKFSEYYGKYVPEAIADYNMSDFEYVKDLLKHFKGQPKMGPGVFNNKHYKTEASALKAFFRKYPDRKDQFYREQKLV